MFKRAIILMFLLCLFIPNNALAVKVSIPHTSAYKGALVEVPVNLDHAEALGGFQMTVTYDFTALRVSDVTSGDLSPSSPWTIVRAIDTPGQIKVVAYDSSLNGPSGTSGSFIKILFLVTGGQGRDIDISIAGADIILSDIYSQPIPVSAANGFAAKGLLHVYVMDNDFDGVVDDVDKCPDLNNPSQTDTDGDGIGNECGERCQSTVYKPVKLNNNYYTSLQDAYDAAANGATIYLQSETLYQNLIATLNKSVTIDGGYNCAYSGYDLTVPYTILKGEIVNESPSVLTLKNVFVSKYANTIVDCSSTSGLNLSDSDHDGTPDACEACPPSIPSCDPDTVDTDHDGMPDSYEIPYGLNRFDPFDKDLDPDEDGLTNLQESQSGTDPYKSDMDTDDYPDSVDKCPDLPHDQPDLDGDCITDAIDNCIDIVNADQTDTDADGVGDACDNCVYVDNPDQVDMDDDGIGQECETCDYDLDHDGYGYLGQDCQTDNCPSVHNPSQADADGDGIGDACDICTSLSPAQSDFPIKVGSSYYSSLQRAYDEAQNGAVIQVQIAVLYQDLVLNAVQTKSITLDGGYSCDFTNVIYLGPTILRGEIRNFSSSLTLKNFSIENPSTHDDPDICTEGTAGECIMDVDGDGMPDIFEVKYGLTMDNPSDGNGDKDVDGLTNLQEYLLSTNPEDSDSDNDGLPDGNEYCPPIWTDITVGTNITVIKAAHFTELRHEIIYLRSENGLAPYIWTNPEPVPNTSLVKAEDMTDLCKALGEVLQHMGKAVPNWDIDPDYVRGTPISGSHILQLRQSVQDVCNWL